MDLGGGYDGRTEAGAGGQGGGHAWYRALLHRVRKDVSWRMEVRGCRRRRGRRPVSFRIGANAGGAGCHAQLNVMAPPGVAPYELRRSRAKAKEGTVWTLRYRGIVLIVDTERGTVVRRESGEVTRTGVLLARPPGVEDPPPAPPARQRERWYGRGRGRFPGLPFPVNLRLSAVGAGRVQGRISMLLMSETFAGRFHGEMLVFRWRDRHVGFVMERGSDAIVYNDYRGRVFRFRRRG